MLKAKLLPIVLLFLALPAFALPGYTLEDESNGLSDFAQFKDSLTGQVEITDIKLGVADDIDVRVRYLVQPSTGATVKGVCLLIPSGENSALVLVRYIDPDELDDLLKALADFEQRVKNTSPEPDMRAYFTTRGRISIGVKYYGKWKGIVKTDGITRTFGSRSFRRLHALLRRALEILESD